MREEAVVTDWSKLGGLVRDARHQLGLTQTEASSRAGVSRSWLARVEAGHRGVELEPLIKLLDALGLVLRLGPASVPAVVSAAASLSSSSSMPHLDVQERLKARRTAWNLPPGRDGAGAP